MRFQFKYLFTDIRISEKRIAGILYILEKVEL